MIETFVMLLAFVLVVLSVVIMLRRKANSGDEALDKANQILKRIDNLDQKITDNRAEFMNWAKAAAGDIGHNCDQVNGIQKKLEVLDLRMNNLRQSHVPTNIRVTMDPLPIQLIDNRPNKTLTDDQVKKKLIKNIQGQIKNLSQ